MILFSGKFVKVIDFLATSKEEEHKSIMNEMWKTVALIIFNSSIATSVKKQTEKENENWRQELLKIANTYPTDIASSCSYSVYRDAVLAL